MTMQAMLMIFAVGAANVLGALMTMPQVRQIFTSRLVEGVSPAWAAAGLVSNAWWLAYGLGTGELAIIPVSVISVICYLAIAVGILRFGRSASPIRGLALGSLIGIVPLPFAVFGGWAAAGLALGMLYGVQLTPAVVEVFRRTDLSGVSSATWAMACVEAALWGLYAVPRRDVGVITLGLVGVVMTSLVLVRLSRWRRFELIERSDRVGSAIASAAVSF